MIVRNYYINKDHVSDIQDNCERMQQNEEYVLADMLLEPSNYDDTVHFKNDPLDPPNIFSKNHDECDIVFNSKKKRLEERSQSLSSCQLCQHHLLRLNQFQLQRRIQTIWMRMRRWSKKAQKFQMKKRSVILKITHLFPKKTFAKLIDF